MFILRCFLLGFIVFASASPAVAYERRTAVVDAVEKAGPAVVNIRTEQIIKRRSSPFFGFGDSLFDEFFNSLSPPRIYKTQSLGSGVIIDPRGYLLTNAHVIDKASKIYVALPDSTRELEAHLVGMDERIDLAVLKIEGDRKFPYLEPSRSDDLLVGETVIAIGNPLGLGHSITTGVVSAKNRRLPMGDGVFSSFVQTDALINPGNSGGPLININGELIGINTAIAKKAQGIGFAIPIDTAKRVMQDLITYGRVRRAFFGVIPGSVGKAFSRARGAGGVLVNGVEPGSPAAAAGIKVADVILGLDGNPVGNPAELHSLLHTYTPEDQVVVELLRGTRTRQLTLRLTPTPDGYGGKYAREVFGFTVYDSRRGLAVEKVVKGSPADQVGMQAADMVAEVDGQKVASAQEFSEIIESVIGQEPVRFLVLRGNRGYYLDLP